MIRKRSTILKTTRDDFLTDVELAKSLSRFSPMAQKAILFSLLTHTSPEETTLLTWEEAKRLRLDKPSIQLLRTLPVHINSLLVFWKQTSEGEVYPIYNLNSLCRHIANGKDWSTYQEAFDRMIYVADSSVAFNTILIKHLMTFRL